MAVKAGFRSGLEKSIADDLASKDIKYEFEKHQIKYTKPVRGGQCGACGSKAVGKQHTYCPDFRITYNGVFVESKGRFTAADRTKLAAVRSQHPELELRLLFQADNYTTKLHKQRYSEWAEKHGFQWSVGNVIPAEWLN